MRSPSSNRLNLNLEVCDSNLILIIVKYVKDKRFMRSSLTTVPEIMEDSSHKPKPISIIGSHYLVSSLHYATNMCALFGSWKGYNKFGNFWFNESGLDSNLEMNLVVMLKVEKLTHTTWSQTSECQKNPFYRS